jgi:hypothetical protein
VAGALETAHRAQVIHRDIKPANILVSSFGDAQLTDFGIARISGGHETRSGVITASMAHAPPEVLDGQRPSISGDVYSLGSTIFELMYGGPAFEDPDDETMVPMLRRILSDPPPDLRARGVPDEICRVLERAMAKDPAQRQVSAVQFGRELQAARRSLGLEAGRLTVPAEVSVEPGAGAEVSFVTASQVLCTTCHHEVPGGVDRCPNCGTMVGAGLPPSPAATGPAPSPTGAPTVTSGATTGPVGSVPSAEATGAVPPYAAVSAAPRRRNTGVLVGVGVLVLALLVAGVIVALSLGGSDVATPTTTTAAPTTAPSTTATPTTDALTDYTPEIEANFIEACLQGDGGTPLLCRCIFRGIRQEVPFEDFLDIERDVNQGGSLRGTVIEPIVQRCAAAGTDGDATTTEAPPPS